MKKEKTEYKMSDLVRLSGVSRQTIHFYLREGLLLPPVRKSRNMAYYDKQTVEDIRFIKELQEKYYLPLAVIKKVLQSKREGRDLGEEDHLLVLQQIYWLSGSNSAEQFDERSFLAKSELTKQELHHLISIGLVSPTLQAGKKIFDSFDLAIAIALKKLTTMGIQLDDLRLYADFLNLIRLEATLVHDRILHKDTNKKHQPLGEIQITLERVKNLLTAKAYREFFAYHFANSENGYGG